MTVPIAPRGLQVLGVSSLFLALTTLAVALRCYCRALVVKNFGLDDVFAIVSWLLFSMFCSFAITGCFHGSGQHIALLPPAEIPVGLRWWWSCEPVYIFSNMALKFSIAIFLLRIAVARGHKIIIWTTIVVVEIYSLFFVLLFILQCRPSAYFWTQFTGGKGTCLKGNMLATATYVYSAVAIVSDLVLGIIPVFIIRNLQMNSRTKLVIGMILAGGAIASTATIIRIPYIKNLNKQGDFLYDSTDLFLWSAAETGLGIIASACATLRPLFHNFFARSHLFGGTSSNSASRNRWPKTSGPSSGYVRQQNSSRHQPEEFGLRSDIGKGRNVGITTVIGGADTDIESGMGSDQWNTSVTKLTEVSSDEDLVNGSQRPDAWKVIKKTTVSTQVAEAT